MSKKPVIRRRTPAARAALPDDMPPILQAIYAHRGIRHRDELNHQLKALLPAQQLKGLAGALDLLEEVIRAEGTILIVGDFDADGATSCALAVLALRALGAARVNYLVPNRFEFGYGLTPEIVEVALPFEPDLLVTVDNGIASLAGVEAAREAGMSVLVTDHHLPGAELPLADAIINPNQPGCEFPSKHLAGVGVIFYVMAALSTQLDESGWFAEQGRSKPSMAQFLDLVALGTVADVVPLDRNNRILVQQGVQRIRAGQCRPGVRALIEVAGRSLTTLTATDLGFVIGPRLNAAGRLNDMSHGIECLLTDNEDQARQFAQELDALNKERRSIEADMQREAYAALEHLQLNDQSVPLGLCIYQRDWHQGVIGILASRIKDRFHRPVIAFARGNPGELKGSARSVAGAHIRDILDRVATRNPGMISKFGGHAMAAGLTLPEAHYDVFCAAFNAAVGEVLSEADLTGELLSDGELGGSELALPFARLLRDAGPWGQGFPEPVFDGVFEVLEQRLVGERHLKLVLTVPESNRIIDAIAFNVDLKEWPNTRASRIRLVYKMSVNQYRGVESPQLMVDYLEAV